MRSKTIHQYLKYGRIFAQRATCVNYTPVFEVGTNIGAEGYVRSTSGRISNASTVE